MLVVSIPFSGFFVLDVSRNKLLVSLTGRGSCRLKVTFCAHGDKTVVERERDGERAPPPILLGVHISQSFGGWAEVNTGLTTDLAQRVHDQLLAVSQKIQGRLFVPSPGPFQSPPRYHQWLFAVTTAHLGCGWHVVLAGGKLRPRVKLSASGKLFPDRKGIVILFCFFPAGSS